MNSQQKWTTLQRFNNLYLLMRPVTKSVMTDSYREKAKLVQCKIMNK